MLKEIDLKLFEILDSEVDKSFNKWCIYISDFTKIYREIHKWEVIKDNGFNYYKEWWDLFKIDKIIWHYPTSNTILRYVNKKKPNFSIVYNNQKLKVIDNYVVFKLDTTKEIIDYTDEQKQELYDFIKTLKLN